jgi:hypothetical protein
VDQKCFQKKGFFILELVFMFEHERKIERECLFMFGSLVYWTIHEEEEDVSGLEAIDHVEDFCELNTFRNLEESPDLAIK